MNPKLGMLLAGSFIILGIWQYGWRGLLMAVTVIVFWLVLQFNRTTRVLQNAAARPVGKVPSAVMLQARLSPGMSMEEVLKLTGSLGQQEGSQDDWRWEDEAGNVVVVHLRRGHVVRWSFARGEAADEPGGTDTPAPPPPGAGS